MMTAVTQLLLSRYSGQRDIALGTAVSGRERAALEGLVGFFVNTLVLRSRIDESRSFAELLGGVRETVRDAFAHQDVAEAVVGYLAPVRERYAEVRSDEDGLERTLAAGAEKARALASATLAEVRVAMGVGPSRPA